MFNFRAARRMFIFAVAAIVVISLSVGIGVGLALMIIALAKWIIAVSSGLISPPFAILIVGAGLAVVTVTVIAGFSERD